MFNFFSMSLLLIIILNITGMAQQIRNEYDFPAKPGMPEWKNFKTHAE
jgi:hypothetical protein